MKKIHLVIASVVIAAICAAVYGDAESYKELRTTPTQSVDNGVSAESTDASTIIASRAQRVNGNPSIAVSADFTGAAGDTAVITCILYRGIHSTALVPIGVQTSTATAGAYVDSDGDSIAPTLFFESAGANAFEIRHAAPSTGSLDLTVWAFGAASR